VELAATHALTLLETVAAASSAVITTSFNRLNTPAMEAMVGRMSDGSPLSGWLAQFGPETAGRLRESLQTAAALGTNPRGVARILARELDIAQTRLLTMARSEILGSYRDASLASYRANSDLVSGWVWICAKQTRTCLACVSLDGKRFGLDEPFQRSHLNCRCSSAPLLKGETKLPVESGREWFQSLPEADQRRMIPPTAWEEFRSGRLILDDFVHLDRDERWGDRYTQSSVRQARANAYIRTQLAAA